MTDNGVPNPHDCPSCHSTNTSSLRMAFESGTSISQSSTVGIGVSLDGIGVGGAKTTGMSQSITAQSVQPPTDYLPYADGLLRAELWLFVPWLALSAVLTHVLDSKSGYLIALCIMAIPSYFIIKYTGEVNAGIGLENRKKLEKYEHTWLCHRCGVEYEPIPFDAEKVSKDGALIGDYPWAGGFIAFIIIVILFFSIKGLLSSDTDNNKPSVQPTTTSTNPPVTTITHGTSSLSDLISPAAACSLLTSQGMVSDGQWIQQVDSATTYGCVGSPIQFGDTNVGGLANLVEASVRGDQDAVKTIVVDMWIRDGVDPNLAEQVERSFVQKNVAIFNTLFPQDHISKKLLRAMISQSNAHMKVHGISVQVQYDRADDLNGYFVKFIIG